MVYHGNSASDTDFPYACFKEGVTNDRDRIVILFPYGCKRTDMNNI